MLCCLVWGWMGGGGAGVGWGGSGRGVLIDNGRVYQSKAADALVPVKTTKFGTNVGLNMLLNISSRYFGGLFWSRQLRGLPSSDGYFFFQINPSVGNQLTHDRYPTRVHPKLVSIFQKVPCGDLTILESSRVRMFGSPTVAGNRLELMMRLLMEI